MPLSDFRLTDLQVWRGTFSSTYTTSPHTYAPGDSPSPATFDDSQFALSQAPRTHGQCVAWCACLLPAVAGTRRAYPRRDGCIPRTDSTDMEVVILSSPGPSLSDNNSRLSVATAAYPSIGRGDRRARTTDCQFVDADPQAVF